jgi:hypothetical protein
LSVLETTNWWKTHSQNQRSWYSLNVSDPATALESVRQEANTILHSAQTMGVAMSGGQAQILATQSLQNGWDQTQLTDAILRGNEQGFTHGTLGATLDQLKGLADKYTVPVSQPGLQQWTNDIISGKSTQANFQDYLVRQAKSLYRDPNLQKALDEGMTVRDYADPYIQSASSLLGLNPNDVNLNDPKWNQALQFTDPQGNRRSMTLDEWATHVKMDPRYGYDYSMKGRADAATLVSSIRQEWGLS